MNSRRVGELAVRFALIGIVVGLAVLVGLRVKDYVDKPPKMEAAKVGKDEMTVGDAFMRRPGQAVVVRGYVFAGDGFPVRVCNGIHRTSPAQCVGPYLELRNLDPSRVPVTKKGDVIWSPEPVAFLGRVEQDRFMVQELLQ